MIVDNFLWCIFACCLNFSALSILANVRLEPVDLTIKGLFYVSDLSSPSTILWRRKIPGTMIIDNFANDEFESNKFNLSLLILLVGIF